MGRCYGNCVDDQSNLFDYSITNPVFLPTTADYLHVTATQKPLPNWFDKKCHINNNGNLLDSNDSVIATNVKVDPDGNFVDNNNNKIVCPIFGSNTPSSSSPVGSPSGCHVDNYGKLIDPHGYVVANRVFTDVNGNFMDNNNNKIVCPIPTWGFSPVGSPIM